MARQEGAALAQLQKLRPAKLRVYVRDSDDGKLVGIPAQKKKWEALGRVLEGMDWERIEALDVKGAIVGVVKCAEDELAEDEEVIDELGASVDRRVTALLGLMLQAQKVALAAQRDQMGPLLDGLNKSITVMTSAVESAANVYRMALAAATTLPVAKGAEGSDEEFGNFMKLVMMMGMQRGLPGPSTPKPVNGASPRPQTSAGTDSPRQPGANGPAPGRSG